MHCDSSVRLVPSRGSATSLGEPWVKDEIEILQLVYPLLGHVGPLVLAP